MKKLLSTLAVLFCFAQVQAQTTVQGNPNSTVWYRGSYMIDTILAVPYRDTVAFTPAASLRFAGRLTVRPADGALYYHNGTSWTSAVGTGGGGGGANNYPTSLSYSTGTGNLTLGRNGLASLAAFIPFADSSRYATIHRDDTGKVAIRAAVAAAQAFSIQRANHTGTQTAATISDFTSTARGTLSAAGAGLTYNSSTGVFTWTNPGYISNATGLISAGTNVTITGSGTAVAPYVISASGSGGGGSTDTTLVLHQHTWGNKTDTRNYAIGTTPETLSLYHYTQANSVKPRLEDGLKVLDVHINNARFVPSSTALNGWFMDGDTVEFTTGALTNSNLELLVITQPDTFNDQEVINVSTGLTYASGEWTTALTHGTYSTAAAGYGTLHPCRTGRGCRVSMEYDANLRDAVLGWATSAAYHTNITGSNTSFWFSTADLAGRMAANGVILSGPRFEFPTPLTRVGVTRYASGKMVIEASTDGGVTWVRIADPLSSYNTGVVYPFITLLGASTARAKNIRMEIIE